MQKQTFESHHLLVYKQFWSYAATQHSPEHLKSTGTWFKTHKTH